MEDKKKDNYEVICMACGMALKRHEIAVQVTGQTVDFEDRICIQNTGYYFCTECAEKSRAYIAQGLKMAIARRDEQRAKLVTMDLSSLKGDAMIIGS